MNRAHTVELFRKRLEEVIQRSGLTRSSFAQRAGIDRSTLSQLLSPENDRLPRVETLASIAASEHVSIDWLVGLSQEGQLGADVLKQSIEVAPDADSPADERLAAWHAEAAGYKIRYVPTTLPDVLKLDDVIEFEYSQFVAVDAQQSRGRSQIKLDSLRQGAYEMEVCNSRQAVEAFARGAGIWQELSPATRRAQLAHMAELCEELYPAFRWFLYDGRSRFSAPLTVFGPRRAVLYVGQMYFVFKSVEHIRALTRHFDDLVRAAVVQPPAVGELLRRLAAELG